MLDPMAQHRPQEGRVRLPQLAYGENTERPQLWSGLPADTPHPGYRHRVEKVMHLFLANPQEAIRFSSIRGELGQKFVMRHADRRGKTRFRANPLLDLLSDFERATKQPEAAGHVEKSHIQ